MKYNFYTGELAKKKTYKGYKYLGKGKLGKIKTGSIDKKKFYYLIDFFRSFSRISPNTFKKSKFKKAQLEDWDFKEKFFGDRDYVDKKKSEKELVFKTKIIKDDGFTRSISIKLGSDNIFVSSPSESNIIGDLQLKNNDELIVKIAKVDKSKQGGKE